MKWIDHPIVNALWFNLFWLVAVLGREALLPLSLLLLALHFLLATRARHELRLVLLVALPGMVMDAILSHVGIYQFPHGERLPLWLAALWVAFAVSLPRSMGFLARFPLLAILFGGIGGTLSYFGGSQLGAVTLAAPTSTSLAVIGVAWAILFPIFLKLTVTPGRKEPCLSAT